MDAKVCSKCNIEFPATIEYFHKSKTGKYGLYSMCKECKNKKTNEYKKTLGSEAKERIKEQCKKSWHKNKNNYAEKRKQWECKNSEEIKLYRKKYYENNREVFIKKAVEYNKINIINHRQSKKKYKKNNYISIQQKNREYYANNKDKSHKYYLENIDMHRLQNRKRKHLIKNSLATLTHDEWQNTIKAFKNRCCYCGNEMNPTTQEHIIPVSKGGGFTKQNIIPCCMRCNISKQDSDMETWYRRQSYFSEERLQKIYDWIGVKGNLQQLSIL